ncbi:4-phosphoerythronate dehydrogenase PdxB [Pragia fontium]|uniref:4-phosphoerythronate dehydrogenase PdxB n=1 Tax=Pragia fontium TaxID=82985 RepID=UPI000F6FA1DC|nr:4-phosphoerythronate dehydrogenase PdxB [Pragia fontium]VEJ56026.1 Erythronate-4-phosphate dehydrogenase [Pragia fontium]
MKILADENMPYAPALFGQLGDVRLVAGRQLNSESLVDADALMVRSVTKVNQALLSGSKVRFVGSATAGTDHVDEVWLKQNGIGFSAAPGCNAIAVVEYVFSSLLMLAERDSFRLADKTIGIIGVGNVGSRLNHRLKALGIKTLLCDPPRARTDNSETFWPLEKLVKEADILTFHTPLYKDGIDKTFHMVDEAVLAALPPGRILINACRGAVVDNIALMRALEKGKRLSTILDVWEPEPDLLLPLLKMVDIGTPHIAGYTLEGKARGTTQIYQAFSEFLGQPKSVDLTGLLPQAEFNHITFNGELDEHRLKRLIHLVYDVRRDDAPLRRGAGQRGEFDRLRKEYVERREWSSLTVACDNADSAALLQQLGFSARLA